MSDFALRVRDLTRVLGPKEHPAVNGISLEVAAGQIVCLLGPNGAGKTTTAKLCSTLLAPTSGQVHIMGIDSSAKPRVARRHVGLILGGERGFYLRASALDNLLFFADVSGVPRHSRRKNVMSALETVALTERMKAPVEAFSKGMRQRLHIARGLIAQPSLLLLDEPTNGLDPEIALDVRGLVRDLADNGVAILLTTHYLREAEALADDLKLLQHGKITVEGDTATLARASGVNVVSTLSSPDVNDIHLEKVRRIPGVVSVRTEVRDQRTALTVAWQGDANERALAGALGREDGAKLPDLYSRAPSLEESYLTLVTDRGGSG